MCLVLPVSLAFSAVEALSAEASALLSEAVLTEADFLAEIPVARGPTHMDQTLAQTPASVTILDRRTIEASASAWV